MSCAFSSVPPASRRSATWLRTDDKIKRRARNRAAVRPDKSVGREERRRLLGIVAAPIIELGGAGVAMAGGLLHIFELGAVFARRGDEGGAHRVCRVAAIEPEAGR